MSRGRQVLICEHEAPIARLIEVALVRLGHQVTTVGTWAGAMAEMGKAVPSLLVLDTSLPDVTTRDAVDAVRADERTCAVWVVLIGRTRGNYDGPEPFLQKPFNPVEIFRSLG